MISARKAHGLTIVEVLVAIALIAIVFAALAAMQASSLRMTRASQEGSRATQIAVDRLNVLTTEVLAQYELYQGCPAAFVTPPCSGSELTDGYTAAHTITRGGGYAASGLVQLTVDVSGPANATVSSYISCMDTSENIQVAGQATVLTDDDEWVSRTPTIRDPWVCAASQP